MRNTWLWIREVKQAFPLGKKVEIIDGIFDGRKGEVTDYDYRHHPDGTIHVHLELLLGVDMGHRHITTVHYGDCVAA